jgi:thiosulfate/3-mercaptopyruvate sulfurtransferase
MLLYGMPLTTLIDTLTLARHLDDPAFAIVDCRFKLEDVEWGSREYQAGHIPGAVYANLERDLSGRKSGTNGRHPLPDPATFARTLSALGIDDRVQVVAYDQDSGMYASRLWWMLRWMGHDGAAVLDGGLAKWLAEGRPTRAGRERRETHAFQAKVRSEMVANASEVAALLNRKDARLIDGRAPERFRGENETLDKKAGHIPGAANHFFKWNVRDDNTFRPGSEIRARIGQALGGVPPEDAVCYCGSGVTACHNLLAMERAGLTGARLYPGSWSEWSSDPSRPTDPK